MFYKEKRRKKKHLKKFISIKDNFLDTGLIDQINTYVSNSRDKLGWRTSYAWDNVIRRSTIPVPILELPDEFSNAIQEKLRKTSPAGKQGSFPFRSQYYLYSPGSYIGWHDDTKYKFASMIYLNKVWNLDWGGLFLHEDIKNRGIQASAPVFNRCVMIGGGIPHGVSILAPDAPLRRVIVTFGPVIPGQDLEKKTKAWQDWRTKRSMDCKLIAEGF